MKSLRSLCALAALLALAVPAPVRAAVSGTPYTIDVVLPLTGSAAFLGKSDVEALTAFEKYTNAKNGVHGRPLHFDVSDDQSNPQVGLQLANAAIAKHPAVIIGSTLSAVCNAMAPQMTSVVQYCLSPSVRTTPDNFVFASGIPTKGLITALIRYYRIKGLTKLAFIVSTDASGQDGERSILDSMQLPENRSMQNVALEHFNPSDISIAAQTSHITQAHPQAVIAWSTGTPIGTVLRSFHDAGLNVPVGTTNGNMNADQLAQYAGFLPAEFDFPTFRYLAYSSTLPGPVKDSMSNFLKAMKEAHVNVSSTHAYAWDPAQLIVNALNKLGPNATAEQLRSYLATGHGFVGANGIYDFRDGSKHGLTDSGVVIGKWMPAQATWIAVSHAGGAPLK
jgi:branched-chain amino acid transport system substrate-binding protein